LDNTDVSALVERLALLVPAPICAMWLKTASVTPGTFNVVVLLKDATALDAFADNPVLKGQFTPAFSGQSDLMRHDVLVFCTDGRMFAGHLDARWQIDSSRLIEQREYNEVRARA
jgi:hypothetical protein